MSKKRRTSKQDNLIDEILEAKLKIEEKKRELQAWEDHLKSLEYQKEKLMELVIKG